MNKGEAYMRMKCSQAWSSRGKIHDQLSRKATWRRRIHVPVFTLFLDTVTT